MFYDEAIKFKANTDSLANVKNWLDKVNVIVKEVNELMLTDQVDSDDKPVIDALNKTQKAYNDSIQLVDPNTNEDLVAIKAWLDKQIRSIDEGDYKYKWEDGYKNFPQITDKINAETQLVVMSTKKNEYKNRSGSILRQGRRDSEILCIMPAGIFYEDDKSKYKTQLDRYKKIYDDLTQLYLNDSITDLELSSLIKFLEKDDTIKKSKNRDEPLKFIEEIMNRTNNAQPNADVAVTSSSNSLETTGASQVTSDIGWFNRTMNNVVKWLIPPPNKNLVKSN